LGSLDFNDPFAGAGFDLFASSSSSISSSSSSISSSKSRTKSIKAGGLNSNSCQFTSLLNAKPKVSISSAPKVYVSKSSKQKAQGTSILVKKKKSKGQSLLRNLAASTATASTAAKDTV